MRLSHKGAPCSIHWSKTSLTLWAPTQSETQGQDDSIKREMICRLGLLWLAPTWMGVTGNKSLHRRKWLWILCDQSLTSQMYDTDSLDTYCA